MYSQNFFVGYEFTVFAPYAHCAALRGKSYPVGTVMGFVYSRTRTVSQIYT